jgi:hypothetical protein
MSNRVPTVTVETKNGPVRINESDYLAAPDDYTLVTDDVPTSDDNAPAVTVTDDAPPSYLVKKVGKKFYVVNSAGDKVDTDKISKDGYATDKEAWDAVLSAAS